METLAPAEHAACATLQPAQIARRQRTIERGLELARVTISQWQTISPRPGDCQGRG